MPARRISKTEKALRLLEAILIDTSVFLSYGGARKILKNRYEGKIGQALSNLDHQGYLEVVERKGQRMIRLTCKGWLKGWRPRIRHTWDGRWRLVAFDIEEIRRSTRDGFRKKLRMLKFKPMQKSLWISPYDVSEHIEKLIDMLDLVENVDYFIADAITNESKFISMFNLKKTIK